MNILAARRYISPRTRALTPDETETRRLAYAIKHPGADWLDYDTAGREMAALISGPCWLVPIPDSTGNTDANAKLAHAIARYCPGAQVARALRRTAPTQSQCARHKLALGPLRPEQMHMARTRIMLTLRATFLVDNVTTSGNTFQAARDALGHGTGLVFADAATRQTQLQATLL